MDRPLQFSPTRIFGTSFESGPLWPLWSFRSATPKCPFPFEKIVVPSAALFCPAYKNNNQSECTVPSGAWNFQNFKPKFLLSGECPRKSCKLYTGHPEALNSLHFFRVQPWYFANHSHYGLDPALLKSLYVSGKLPTYPSPKPTFCSKWEVSIFSECFFL